MQHQINNSQSEQKTEDTQQGFLKKPDVNSWKVASVYPEFDTSRVTHGDGQSLVMKQNSFEW